MNALRNSLVLSVVTLGLFAGVLLAASMAISPSLALLDAAEYVVVKQAQIRILQVAMTAISTAYTLFAIAVLVMQRKERAGATFRLTAVALLLVIALLVYSGVTDIPYNMEILSWDPAAPPPNWSSVRDAWDFANRVRTVPAVIAFVLQSMALLPKAAAANA